MTEYQNRRGALSDRVELRLGGDALRIAESYEVRSSIFASPASFALHLGTGDKLSTLIKRYPPRTPFELFVGGVRQQTGVTDGFTASDGSGGGTFNIEGRDVLAPIHDGMVQRETSFTGDTYINLVSKVALETNCERPYDEQPCIVFGSNGANRELMTGGKILVQQEQDVSTEETVESANAATGTVVRQIRAKLGESWQHFLKRHLDPAGLFLWASASGNLVVSRPTPDQSPIYRIYRDENGFDERGNVVAATYRNITRPPRYSEAVVYTRGRGRKFGRSKLKGGFVDDEMTELGYRRELVLRDVNATDPEQAEFIARRHLAEGRRQGFSLTYTLSGHSAPAFTGGRAVWAFDTMVHVVDRFFGIDEEFYISDVVFRRNPSTTVELTLVRPADLIFGGIDLE